MGWLLEYDWKICGHFKRVPLGSPSLKKSSVSLVWSIFPFRYRNSWPLPKKMYIFLFYIKIGYFLIVDPGRHVSINQYFQNFLYHFIDLFLLQIKTFFSPHSFAPWIKVFLFCYTHDLYARKYIIYIHITYNIHYVSITKKQCVITYVMFGVLSSTWRFIFS